MKIMETNYLAKSLASDILEELKSGKVSSLVDRELIELIHEIMGRGRKLIMIEEDNEYHLIGVKGIGPSYHCIIAFIYMLQYDKKEILILGGGEICFSNNKFIVYGASSSFGQMDDLKVYPIMQRLNAETEPPGNSYYSKEARKYSYEEIERIVHLVLSD
jgi:hypothetical protein